MAISGMRKMGGRCIKLREVEIYPRSRSKVVKGPDPAFLAS